MCDISKAFVTFPYCVWVSFITKVIKTFPTCATGCRFQDGWVGLERNRQNAAFRGNMGMGVVP